MSKKYVTSDRHFFHKNIIQYCNRPYRTCREMDKDLLFRHNSIVRPQDFVYDLGDFGFGNVSRLQALREQLNGNMALIRGNHDGSTSRSEKIFGKGVVFDYLWYNDDILMIHDPGRADTSGLTDKNIIIHGHCHNTVPKFWRKAGILCVNMSVEHWDYKPVLLDEVIEQAKEYGKSKV